MAQFICTDKCFHEQTLWRRGQVVECAEKELPFDKDGKMVHFKLLADTPAPVKPKQKKRKKIKRRVKPVVKPESPAPGIPNGIGVTVNGELV